MRAQITLRMARPADVAPIMALVNGYASDKLMLPVTAERVVLALEDFVVAVDARGRVRGCGALKEYSPSLAEVASLAVARGRQSVYEGWASSFRTRRAAEKAAKGKK